MVPFRNNSPTHAQKRHIDTKVSFANWLPTGDTFQKDLVKQMSENSLGLGGGFAKFQPWQVDAGHREHPSALKDV